MQVCLIVPHYNHDVALRDFLPKLLNEKLPIIIVDDGSEPDSLDEIEALAEQNTGKVYLFKHAYNRGKGAAVKSGTAYAGHLGFSHCIQIDADGQHNEKDIARFVEAAKQAPDTIICGRPTFDESAPKVRLYGRKVTDVWVAIETLSFEIKDGLCGFRLYPTAVLQRLFDDFYIGARMDFDPEILVKAIWSGEKIKFIDTPVNYLEGGVSHFDYWRDNVQFVKLHIRLLVGMIPHIPRLIGRQLRRLF